MSAIRALAAFVGQRGRRQSWLPKACLPALALLAAFCMLAPPPVEAADTYYRWRDERGRLVVSDRPPADKSITYEVVSPKSPLIRRVAPGEGAVPPETEPRPGNEFDQVDTTQDNDLAVVRKNPELCARAQSNLETLDSAARIRIRDENDGQLRYLTEEEKDLQRQKAREIIRVHCE